MALINDAISSLLIQNRNIYNFFSYAVNRYSNEGLFKYNNQYRRDNIFSNFNGGNEGRYGISSLSSLGKIEDTTNSKVFNKNTGELGQSILTGNKRGESYVNENTSNANLSFLTTDEFLTFQSILRKELLNKYRDDTKKNNENNLVNYYGEILNDSSNIFSNSLKDEELYSIDTNNKKVITKFDFDTFGENYRNYYVEKKNTIIKKLKIDTVARPYRSIYGYNIKYEGFIKSNGNNINYTYYEENNGTTVPTELNGGNVYDGTTLSIVKNPSGIVNRINRLFRNSDTNTLINRFHTNKANFDSELITSYSKYGLSRGRNLLTKEAEEGNPAVINGYTNPYCRVWTAHYQYSKLKDRIRPFIEDDSFMTNLNFHSKQRYGNLRTNNAGSNLDTYGVLKNNGYVRITPEHDDSGNFFNGKSKEIKNYMFSLENLAWKDNEEVLSEEQKGPNHGRIMWFPPYNLKFNENINVNWKDNDFIGRGEKIYTYVNTDREGTLSFSLLIDHPSLLNRWRGTSSQIDEKERREQDILRFFAGCGTLDEPLNSTNNSKEEEENDGKEAKLYNNGKDIAYTIFFQDRFSGYDKLKDKTPQGIENFINAVKEYEYGASQEISQEIDADYNNYVEGKIPANRSNYSLNRNLGEDLSTEYKNDIRKILFSNQSNIEINSFDKLITDLNKQIDGEGMFGEISSNCKIDSVDINAYYSKEEDYTILSRRQNAMKRLIDNFIVLDGDEKITYGGSQLSDNQGYDLNEIYPKYSRAATVIFHIKWNDENKPSSDSISGFSVSYNNFDEIENSSENNNITQIIQEENTDKYSYDNEYLYFSSLKEKDNLVYKNIIDKIKYFNPAFHSITPEGFNARLSFLHQCTRQGSTQSLSSGKVNENSDNYLKYAGNLSFGRAPYCVLRIGDFFNTKICIKSISIDYGANGVQWDLNPEGAGVQPMMADINITFSFIGGQDISGPINRLQNAITSNFYANESVYNKNSNTKNE